MCTFAHACARSMRTFACACLSLEVSQYPCPLAAPSRGSLNNMSTSHLLASTARPISVHAVLTFLRNTFVGYCSYDTRNTARPRSGPPDAGRRPACVPDGERGRGAPWSDGPKSGRGCRPGGKAVAFFAGLKASGPLRAASGNAPHALD